MPADQLDVAALVERMPDTDNQVQAKPPPDANQPGQATARPRSDRSGEASKFTGPDPELAAGMFTALLSGGRDAISELIALVRDPADLDFKNYKAGYLLHGVVLFAGRPGEERSRRGLAETLATHLGNERLSKGVRGFLIRELQVVGGAEVVAALGKLLLDDDFCEPAVQALIAIREGAAAEMRRAWPGAQPRHRVTLLQAFGVLRDQTSVVVMLEALGDSDPNTRLTAIWALANLGDVKVVEAVIKAADAATGWERIQSNKACLLLAERLAGSGEKAAATRLYTHLRDTRKNAESYIGVVAERALNEAL